jgi:hypothetical protein
MGKRIGLAGLALVAALGFATVAPGTAAFAKESKQFVAPEGFKLESDGTLIHKTTGTRFPLLYNGFARTNNFAYDASGKDISVVYSYAVGKQTVEVRIALVQIMMMSAHEHYAGLAPVVGTYFSDLHFAKVMPLGDGAIALEGVKPDHAWQGRFKAMRGKVPYTLSLTTISKDHWDARITAAYPTALSADAQAKIVGLATEIQKTSPLG